MGEAVGKGVSVGGTNVFVGIALAAGEGGRVGGAEVAQEVSRMSKRTQKPDRFMNPLYGLTDVGVRRTIPVDFNPKRGRIYTMDWANRGRCDAHESSLWTAM
jgi:hypothetical protein